MSIVEGSNAGAIVTLDMSGFDHRIDYEIELVEGTTIHGVATVEE
jgi:hypothetical protein